MAVIQISKDHDTKHMLYKNQIQEILEGNNAKIAEKLHNKI